jgi:hypothetical protein
MSEADAASGGHTAAHAPLQFDTFAVSAAKTYNVNPFIDVHPGLPKSIACTAGKDAGAVDGAVDGAGAGAFDATGTGAAGIIAVLPPPPDPPPHAVRNEAASAAQVINLWVIVALSIRGDMSCNATFEL